jgi:Spy/CpxP family protein refolding chaperone
MRRTAITALLLSLTAIPVSTQAQNAQQFLQGLTSGDRSHDDQINQAFQRGYQKGRQDEAQIAAGQRRGSSGDYNTNIRQPTDRSQYPSNANPSNRYQTDRDNQ